MKKIIYITIARLPTEKAHGIQIMNTCYAIAKQGVEVELIMKDSNNPITQDIWEFYNLENNFKITKIKAISIWKPYYFGFWLQRIEFSFKLLFYLFRNNRDNFVIYSRDEFVLFTLIFKIKNLFWEPHQGRKNIIVSILQKFLSGIVCITQGGKDFFKKKFSDNKIIVVPDAVDLKKFDINFSKEKSREVLGIPNDKKIITYIGSIGLYDWKGVDVFLDASTLLSEYSFIVVGGNEEDINKLRLRYKNNNIIFKGKKPQSEIPIYQKASDVLIIPNKSGSVVSEIYTSPMKLFEYMASGTPIISSDLPSIREILSENLATFFSPNNSKDLADKIKYVLSNIDESLEKSNNARIEVEKYTYNNRAKKIVEFCKNMVDEYDE